MDAGNECSWTSLALLLFNSVLVLSSLTPFFFVIFVLVFVKNRRQKRPPPQSASVKTAQHQFFFFIHIYLPTYTPISIPVHFLPHISVCFVLLFRIMDLVDMPRGGGFLYSRCLLESAPRLPMSRVCKFLNHPCSRFDVSTT